jgi:hypothetical protein
MLMLMNTFRPHFLLLSPLLMMMMMTMLAMTKMREMLPMRTL